MSFEPASMPINENGGYYTPGGTYGLGKKLEVHDVYCELMTITFPSRPTVRKVAEMAKVSHQYASKVMDETDKYGGVIDPKDLRQAKKDEKGWISVLVTGSLLIELQLESPFGSQPTIQRSHHRVPQRCYRPHERPTPCQRRLQSCYHSYLSMQ